MVSSSFLFLLQYIYKHISASIQGFACFDFQTQLPPSDFSSTSRRQASTSSASFMVSHAHCHLSYTLLNPLCTNHRLHPSPGSRQSHAAYSHFRWPCPSMTVSLLTLSSAGELSTPIMIHSPTIVDHTSTTMRSDVIGCEGKFDLPCDSSRPNGQEYASEKLQQYHFEVLLFSIFKKPYCPACFRQARSLVFRTWRPHSFPLNELQLYFSNKASVDDKLQLEELAPWMRAPRTIALDCISIPHHVRSPLPCSNLTMTGQCLSFSPRLRNLCS